MGIINVTPDSFSDGGSYKDLDAVCARAREMCACGAQIIDIGGESTRPGAEPVSIEEELHRVLESVRRLVSLGMCVSIDTRHAEVARACVQSGAMIINDVSGFRDPEMKALACACDAGLVVMHMQGDPATMQVSPTYSDVVSEVCEYLTKRAADLEAAGIAHDRICIDPGPGFGKTAKQTLDIVRNFQEFVHAGYPVMAALSRKSYIGHVYGIDCPADRDEASAQEMLYACELGASIVRTHNVACTKRALDTLRPFVLLGLGCNMVQDAEEDKITQLNKAIVELCHLPDTQIIDIAPFYESEPAYYSDQDMFVNTVVSLRTGLSPQVLLDYLQRIEESLGRVREKENGPRTCDIDILDFSCFAHAGATGGQADVKREVSDPNSCENGTLKASPDLILPHPRVCERDFVVKPLLDILPGYVLADGTSLESIPEEDRVGKAHRI